MGREELWKALADLINEFRKKGETIPSDIMTDLRAAKTLLQLLKADPNCVDNVPSIEAYFGNVESYLVMTAHEKFGEQFAHEWMEKLKEARKITTEEKRIESASRFVPGLPRGQHWVRIQVSKETPKKEVKKLVEELGLSFEEQKDGYMLIYGESEKLKLFVNKTAEKFGGQRRNS